MNIKGFEEAELSYISISDFETHARTIVTQKTHHLWNHSYLWSETITTKLVLAKWKWKKIRFLYITEKIMS